MGEGWNLHFVLNLNNTKRKQKLAIKLLYLLLEIRCFFQVGGSFSFVINFVILLERNCCHRI